VHADTLLELDDVTAGYPRHVVLQGLTVAIQRGTFTGVLGSNGSGKTTLLKTIVGILPPCARKIVWSGEVRIGFVPQRDVLDPVFLLSSLEVVQMVTRGEKQWALECLQSTGTSDLAHKRFSDLSGGQKQRVLIARALATRPAFLVLDEPTAGIDPTAAAAIMELLKSIHAGGLTILMVSHDIALMRRHAQRVIWLHSGKLTEGLTEQMLSRERVLEIFELDLG
jgi:ABC-type Mn2+/Zn2+ transport system ATPase subunit